MYNEDIQEEACKLMIEAGFSMGRILYPISVTTIPNAVASTDEDGPFWYGDMDYMDTEQMITISKKIGKSITIKSATESSVMKFNANS